MIIAGGEGERLRPLTADRPKTMVPVAGRPILEHELVWLAAEGVTDVIVLCGYRGETIMEHVGDGSRFGVRVHYSPEERPLGRGGALRQGYALVPPGEKVIVGLNGDVLTNQPLQPMLRYHRRKMATATVMLTQLRSPYGIAKVERSGRIVTFSEKPLLPHWMNAGVYLFSREFFRRLPVTGDHEDTAFPSLTVQGKLFGYRSKAYWHTVDTIKDLTEVERELREEAPGLGRR